MKNIDIQGCAQVFTKVNKITSFRYKSCLLLPKKNKNHFKGKFFT